MDARIPFSRDTYHYILNSWDQIDANIQAPIFLFHFVLLDDGSFGSYANKTEASFFHLRKLNFLLMQGYQQVQNVSRTIKPGG